MMLKYKPEAIPAIIYVVVSISALLYVFVAPTGASLSGVGVSVLTLPWSILIVNILDSMRIGSAVLNTSLTIISLFLNASILLLICGYFRKKE
jgi:hypothetical protein